MNFRPVPDNEIFYTKLEPVCGNKSQSAFMNCSVAEGDKSIHDNAPILCMQSDPSCIDSAPPGSTVLVPSIDEDWCADFLIHGGDIDWGDQGPPPSDDDVDEDDNGCMGSFGAGGNGPAPFYPNPEGPGAGDDCGPKPITPMMKMEKAINPGSMDNRHIMREVQRGQTR